MKEGPDISRLASLIGDPARANMLTALMGGKALTAKELAQEAGVTAQTASSHLGKLLDGGLVAVRQEGRHRYVRIADAGVANMLERLAGLAADKGHSRLLTGPRDPAMRACRVCYDHLAGDRSVRLYDAMVAAEWFEGRPERPTLTERGHAQLGLMGINLDALGASKRPLCRPCLDWSERRYHLAGRLGAVLLDHLLQQDWAKRLPGSRTVRFTPKGEPAFDAWLGLIKR